MTACGEVVDGVCGEGERRGRTFFYFISQELSGLIEPSNARRSTHTHQYTHTHQHHSLPKMKIMRAFYHGISVLIELKAYRQCE